LKEFNRNRSFSSRPRTPRTERNDQNMLIGMRPLTEAIAAGSTFDKVLIQKGLRGDLFKEVRQLLQDHGIPFQLVPEEKLSRITPKMHQGIVAFVSPIEFGDLSECLAGVYESGATPKFLMLDSVTDVRNFGAISRTAEAMGFHAVIVPEKSSAAINEDAIKTSAGALFNIPVCRTGSLINTARFLQEAGLKLMAASEKGKTAPYEVNLTGPICVIMGNEEKGISNDLIRIAEELVSIPMLGKTMSLNVSVAAGMLMYEINRQRALSDENSAKKP
jgi:23S rRNA (guanosine2251-2'-O)-methyltransferase